MKKWSWLVLVAASMAVAKDVTVVPPGEVEAYFRVYKDLNLEQEASSPLGGVVYPVLYVKLGTGWGIDTDTGTIPVTVTDNYPDYEANTDVDTILGTLDPAGQDWETKAPSGTVWTTGAPGHAQNNLEEPVFYRCRLTWNSMTTPLGNNGKHTLSAPAVKFQHNQDTPVDDKGPAAKTVMVENVWVTDVSSSNGTIDYCKWDPDGDQALREPTITFTIKDADPHNFMWVVNYWRTGRDPQHEDGLKTITGVVAPGMASNVVPVQLYDEQYDEHLDPDLDERSPYTYDIIVWEYQGESPPSQGGSILDEYMLKWPWTMYVANGDHTVECHTDDDGAQAVRVKYNITHEGAAPAADDLKLVVMDSSLSERATVTGKPTAVNTWHRGDDEDGDELGDGIPVYTVPDGDSSWEWRVVWTAANPEGAASRLRRSHDNQRMWATNGKTPSSKLKINIVIVRLSDQNDQISQQRVWIQTQKAQEILARAGVRLVNVDGKPLTLADIHIRDCPTGLNLEDHTQQFGYSSGYDWCGKAGFEGADAHDPTMTQDETALLTGQLYVHGAQNVFYLNTEVINGLSSFGGRSVTLGFYHWTILVWGFWASPHAGAQGSGGLTDNLLAHELGHSLLLCGLHTMDMGTGEQFPSVSHHNPGGQPPLYPSQFGVCSPTCAMYNLMRSKPGRGKFTVLEAGVLRTRHFNAARTLVQEQLNAMLAEANHRVSTPR